MQLCTDSHLFYIDDKPGRTKAYLFALVRQGGKGLKHVIVTGGTGVTGNALVRYLLKQGIGVTALVRRGSERVRNLPRESGLRIVECSMDEYAHIDSSLRGHWYDAFFHLSWDGSMGKNKVSNRNDMYLQLQNAKYMLDAVELCHRIGCPVFLATGTQAEYGKCEDIISEETRENPQNGYGNAKLCAGRMSRIRCKELGIRHIWARLFSVYGPYDGAHSLIDTSIHKLRAGEVVQYTAGEQIWDYLYSYDAAKALCLLAEKGAAGETYCVASGKARPLKEFIWELHEIVAPDIAPVLGAIPYADGQIMRMEVCVDKIKQLGYETEYTFSEGIREIYENQVQML